MHKLPLGLTAIAFGGVLVAQDLTTLRGFYGLGGPSALAIDAAGSRAYVGESAAVSIVDLSVLGDPLPPAATLARIPVDASVVALTLDEGNQRLLIAGGSHGLWSLDLAAPTYPSSSHDDLGDLVCFEVALTSSHVVAVYGADGVSELRVYDRSTLAPVGATPLGAGTAFAVSIDGGFAYVAMGTGGLLRVDLANPAAPVVQPGPVFPIDVLSEPARARDIAVVGGKVYAAVDRLGLVAADAGSGWSPATPWTSHLLTGVAKFGTGPARLYAHRVAVAGAHVYVGANTRVGREADGAPFTSFGPMDHELQVGGVATPSPIAKYDALAQFQIGTGGVAFVQQVDVDSLWRELIARPTRVYEAHSYSSSLVRDSALTVLASYRGSSYQPAEAFLSLRDPDLALCGQDGSGPSYVGLLDISVPDAITPVPGTAALGSFGLWFDAQWADSQPTREWFVGGGVDDWELHRFDTAQPALGEHWILPSPNDPSGGGNGRNYWSSWLDGDLLLLTRGGTRWGLVGYSRSAVEAAANANPSGATLPVPFLWQVETHFAGEANMSQNWRCRTFSIGTRRFAVIGAGFHTGPGANNGRAQVVIYNITAGTSAPPTLVSTIHGPNLDGNAVAVAIERIGAATYLFVVDFGYGLHCYDVSAPAAPVLVGGWASPANVFDGAFDPVCDLELVREPAGGLSAYLAVWRRGLVQLDVGNPAVFGYPVLAAVDTPGLPYGIAIRDVDGSQGLVLADHQAGLRLYGHYAKWQSIGGGCAGAGVTPELSVVHAPVLGGTFELQVDNLGGGSVAMVTGLSPVSLPLQPIDPTFGPGCVLLASPDFVDPLAPVGGTATWTLSIPASPSLVGLQLWNQVTEQAAPSAVSNAGTGVVD